MIRYIIRPPGILTTPKLLRYALGARRTVRSDSDRVFSLERDFFLSYPPVSQIREFQDAQLQTNERLNLGNGTLLQLSNMRNRTLNGYVNIRSFFRATKPQQRATLSSLGFSVPETFNNIREFTERRILPEGSSDSLRFIRRPLRHSGGRGYRLCTADQVSDFDSTTEYLQELYPKVHEYRVLVVRGHPLITLKKQVPEGMSPSEPWNHLQGSTFVTVANYENNRLRHTEVFDIITRNSEFFGAIDLAGLDILVNLRHHQPYVVCELNLCPSVTIPSSLQRITEYVQTIQQP